MPTLSSRSHRPSLCIERLEERALLAATVFPTPLELAETQPFTRTEVVARVHSQAPLQDLLGAQPSLLDPAQSRILFGRDGAYTVQVALRAGADPRTVVRGLNALPFVEWASPNFIYQKEGTATPNPQDFIPDDPRFGVQYHHPLMRNTLAWDSSLGSASIVVAVTDDGVDLNHEDLYENIWINPGEIPASRAGNLTDVDGDGVLGFRDLNDPINRGPFMANDTNGDNRIDARDLLAAMQMSGDEDLGGGGWANRLDDGANGYVDDVVGWATIDNTNNPHPPNSLTHGTHVAGIIAARTNNGVGVAGTAGDVTIMPIRFYGNGTWTSAVIAASYAYAADNGARIISTSYTVDGFVNDPVFRAGLEHMYSLGVLHINSAGNQGAANRDRLRLDTTLYVANTDASDRKNSSSNWGWGLDISAPGTNILSTVRNNGYSNLTGTSMSAPNVAGVAALLWSVVPTWTREELSAQLLGTADDIDALNPAFAGLLGTGRVNAGRAMTEFLANPRFRAVVGLPAEGGSTGGQLRQFQVDLRNLFMQSTVQDMANWEMREAGADGEFDTGDDVLTPMTLSMTIGDTYMVGSNRLYFTLANVLAPGTYRFRAVSGGLTDPFFQALDGNGDGTGGDPFDRHFTVLGAGPGMGEGGQALLLLQLRDELVQVVFAPEQTRLRDILPTTLIDEHGAALSVSEALASETSPTSARTEREAASWDAWMVG